MPFFFFFFLLDEEEHNNSSDNIDNDDNDDDNNNNDNGDNNDDGDGDDDDSGDSDDDYDDDFRRRIGLVKWAITLKVPHVIIDTLLLVLRRDWPGGDALPKSSKTLLGTLGARNEIRPMEDIYRMIGEFTLWHSTRP